MDVKDEQVANLQKQIDQLKESFTDSNSQGERKHNIAMSKFEELKKGLQQLKEDLEFYKSMNQMMNDAATTKNQPEECALGV